VQQKEKVKQKVEEMEKQIHMLFQTIPESTSEEAGSSGEKLHRIEKTIQEYKEKIKELEEHVTPTTPPRSQSAERTRGNNSCRGHQPKHTGSHRAAREEHAALDSPPRGWEPPRTMQEKETNIHAAMAKVKQQQKIVSLPEKIKMTTELKALQLEEKALQVQKTTRQALLEPLQEKEEQAGHGE
jgi:hypothetical protein